jgi:hypothetical protein
MSNLTYRSRTPNKMNQWTDAVKKFMSASLPYNMHMDREETIVVVLSIPQQYRCIVHIAKENDRRSKKTR